jgi:phosphoserine phosphatase RsbU/P
MLSLYKYDEHRIQDIIEENTRLKHSIKELIILNDLAKSIGSLNDSDEIMHIVLHRSLDAVDAAQGVITLVDTGAVDSMKTFIREMASSAEIHPIHLHQNLLGWMHLHKRPLLINDPQNDPRFRGVKWDHGIISILCVPLMVKSKLIGILTIYNKRHQTYFTDDDQRLLSIIGAQSAQVLENARLYEGEQKLLLIQHELEVAANIQKVLLPDRPPVIDGYDIAGRNLTAQLVGGDYYDFIPIDRERCAICIGDIAGKGLSAALLMANLQATLRSQSPLVQSAKDCIERSNHLLVNCTAPDRFMTCFYGILDHHNHTLTYCNAGHDPPMLLKDRLLYLHADNLILGTFAGVDYTEQTIPIDPGDMLVMYSDGVTESKNENDEEFGSERLSEIIINHRSQTAEAILETILKSVCCYSDGCPQADDITVVVVKREG